MIISPIKMDFKSANPSSVVPPNISTFNSYTFDRNILVPASAFRFTAPGVEKSLRTSIRSGDTVSLYATNSKGIKAPIGTGFIDETDTHIMPNNVEYVLTGRDTLGQLVDNASVDDKNNIINVEKADMLMILGTLIKNTRIPEGVVPSQTPNGQFLFQTNPGESKINALQRYMEFTNCLVWTLPDGRITIGKPNFTQIKKGSLRLLSDGINNNLLEARVRRNINQAIRQIVTQLQTMDQVYAGTYTKNNDDKDIKPFLSSLIGRSVYNHFSYGQGQDMVNTVTGVGNQSAIPRKIGDELSLRYIARDNMKILDVEAVVEGHLNEFGDVYNIDQIYNVQIDDDDLFEDMYVYACTYDLTMDHGMITRLKLCRLGTICAYADVLQRTAENFGGGTFGNIA